MKKKKIGGDSGILHLIDMSYLRNNCVDVGVEHRLQGGYMAVRLRVSQARETYSWLGRWLDEHTKAGR